MSAGLVNFYLNFLFQHQLQSLQMYVNELSEQNEILVETVEELEREANERVALVESKLQRSGASLKVMIHGPQYISSPLLTFFWCTAFVLGLSETSENATRCRKSV